MGIFYEKYEIQDKNTAALEDFTRFCTLGEGAFGRVMMLQHHGDKQFYAMKILKKERVMEGGQEENCLNEKRVMQVWNIICTNRGPHCVLMINVTYRTNLFLINRLSEGWAK